jgi:inner membrane protein
LDNLTHSLVGWALAETGLKRRTRKGLAALVLAANMPDIDVFFGWVPWAPLAMHRGFTHGLVGGVVLMPPLLAGLLWLLDRWQASRGKIVEGAPPLRLGWLVLLSYLGAITHPLLDLQTVYAVQLLSPWSETWFHADGLFIISPWLLAILGGGIWWARRFASRRAALASLVAGTAFILLNVGISRMAWDAPSLDAPYAHPDRVFASPEPLAFWRRDVVWREGGTIRFGTYDPLKRLTGLQEFGAPLADRMDDPLVRQAAKAKPEAVKFLAWSQMPMAQVAVGDGCTVVQFGDARFTGPRLARNFNVTVRTCSISY